MWMVWIKWIKNAVSYVKICKIRGNDIEYMNYLVKKSIFVEKFEGKRISTVKLT